MKAGAGRGAEAFPAGPGRRARWELECRAGSGRAGLAGRRARDVGAGGGLSWAANLPVFTFITPLLKWRGGVRCNYSQRCCSASVAADL